MMSIMKNLESMLFVIFFASCLFSKSVDSKLQCYVTHLSRRCGEWGIKGDDRFNCFKNEGAIDEIAGNCPTCSIGTITAENGEQFKWAFCDKGDYSCDHDKESHTNTDFYGKITKKIECNICKKDLCNDLPNNKIKGQKKKESKSRAAKKISSIVSVIVATVLLTQL